MELHLEEVIHKKNNHIDSSLSDEALSSVYTGFDDYRLEHIALPEINFSEIDTSVKFLGRKINLPLIISAMTGGGERSAKINRSLSELANDFNICFSVGSQRCALEDATFEKSFKVRLHASNIPILANLGASQLNYGCSLDDCKKAVDMIDADAIVFHLNPLHEVFQINGTTNFAGLLKKIENVCKKIEVPVLIKEVGYGISSGVAKRLVDVGVYAIDVAGAGSISWVEIEKNRSHDIVIHKAASAFMNWGIPTTDCIKSIAAAVPAAKIIASGGVNDGVKMAKSIALGADLCGNAHGFLKRVVKSRSECENYIEALTFELKTAMFCTGCRNIHDLKSAKITKIT